MQYSIGDCLAEYGFQFYENLHHPILLVSKIGKILKINEAGRKLLHISQITTAEIEKTLLPLTQNMATVPVQRIHFNSSTNSLQLIASYRSDYLLVEIMR